MGLGRVFSILGLAVTGVACAAEEEVPYDGPILGGPTAIRHRCQVQQPVSQMPDGWWPTFQLTTDGERPLMARSEAHEFGPASRIVVATQTELGETDVQLVAEASPPTYLALLDFAARPGGWAVLYSREQAIELAIRDEVKLQVIQIPDLQASAIASAQLQAHDQGWWIAFQSASGTPEPAATLLSLDRGGQPRGAPVPLISSAPGNLSYTLAPRAVAWSRRGAADLDRSFYFATLSADGVPGPPQKIQDSLFWGLSFSGSAPQLLAVPEGHVVAFPESEVLWEDGSPIDPLTGEEEAKNGRKFAARTVLRLARFDLEGLPIGASRALTSPEPHREHVSPTLFTYAGELGLIWSTGSVLYGCAGCVPDHDLRFVLLDPRSLKPASEVLSLPYDGTGGLLRSTVAPLGPDLQIATYVTHHVSSSPARAAIRCE